MRTPNAFLRRFAALLSLAASLACALARLAAADEHAFLHTYTPYLGERGEFEVETWLTAARQGQPAATSWLPRAELEYGVTNHLSAAGYLNFSKNPGEPARLDSGSLEWVWSLPPVGRLLDPGLYLETTVARAEWELEPKLLMARTRGPWISGLNVTGELEFRRNDAELLPSGEVLHRAGAAEVSGGVARTLGRFASLAIEARYRSEHPNFGPETAGLVSLGPTLTLARGGAKLGISWLPRIWGRASARSGADVDDLESSEVRVLLALEL